MSTDIVRVSNVNNNYTPVPSRNRLGALIDKIVAFIKRVYNTIVNYFSEKRFVLVGKPFSEPTPSTALITREPGTVVRSGSNPPLETELTEEFPLLPAGADVTISPTVKTSSGVIIEDITHEEQPKKSVSSNSRKIVAQAVEKRDWYRIAQNALSAVLVAEIAYGVFLCFSRPENPVVGGLVAFTACIALYSARTISFEEQQ